MGCVISRMRKSSSLGELRATFKLKDVIQSTTAKVLSVFQSALPTSQSSHIGNNTTSQEVLLSPSDTPDCPIQGQCSIASLPDELLSQVLGYCNSSLTYRETQLQLLLVCKRWRQSQEPFLYHTLNLGYDMDFGHRGCVDSTRRGNLLHMLRKNQHLAGYVRKLKFTLFYPDEKRRRFLAEIIDMCPQTRSFCLRSDWPSTMRPILDASSSLRRLETLKLSPSNGTLCPKMIIQQYMRSTFHTIDVSRFGLGNCKTLGPPSQQYFDGQSLEDLSLLADMNSSPITTAVLAQPEIPPFVIEIFLRWPEALVSLTLERLGYSSYRDMYTRGAIQGILDVHRTTLDHISISLMIEGRVGIPDFSKFSLLKHLTLHNRNLLIETPEGGAYRLTTPCLHSLTVLWKTEANQQVSWSEYGSDHAEWFIHFAACKSSSGMLDKLENVYMDFYPVLGPVDGPSINGVQWRVTRNITWPWAFMEQTQRAFEEQGIKMSYPTPKWSKEGWARTLASRVPISSRY